MAKPGISRKEKNGMSFCSSHYLTTEVWSSGSHLEQENDGHTQKGTSKNWAGGVTQLPCSSGQVPEYGFV